MADKNSLRPIPFDNIPGLLHDLVGEIDRRTAANIKGTRYEALRPFDTKVGVIASRQSKTVSQIARDLSVTRQAVHGAVQRLVELDVVEQLPIPGNSRDKLVAVTEKGWQVQQVALASIGLMEKEMLGVLGAKGLELFRKQLIAVTAAMKLKEIE